MNSDRVGKGSKSCSKINLDKLLKKGAAKEKQCRKAKREAQHAHWMRVMKEGQSTPDLSYQKTDT